MAITYRELIQKVQEVAAEQGDHVLDLPVTMLEVEMSVTGVSYSPPLTETDMYAAEPEQMLLNTNWG